MSITLFGLKPKDTYQALIKVGNNTNLDGTRKVLSDGLGNDLPMEVSTTEVNFTGLVKQGGIALPTASQLALKQDVLVSGTNIKSINGSSILGSGNLIITTSSVWGAITGTLSSQTDLQSALDGKVNGNTAIVGATKTKVTYDAKGLIIAGADATTSDIADSLNKRYVTDSQLTILGNTSGTNSGDNAVNILYSGLALSKQDTLVSATNIKTINSTSILGAGNLAVQPTLVSGTNIQSINGSSILTSGNLALQDTLVSGTNIKTINGTTILGAGNIAISSSVAWGGITGTLSAQTDLQTALNGKQDTLVSATNIKTINGSSVLGAGDLVVSASPSGVAGAIQFSNGSAFASDAANLFWDDTNNRLGIGINVPTATLHSKGSGTTSATNSFVSQNSSGNAVFTIRDDGSVTFQSLGSIVGQVNVTGASFYNVKSLGGFGASKVELSDLMDLYSNDGSLAVRVNNAWVGITDAVAIGKTTIPDTTAMLDMVSTTRGLLPPRMTTVQKSAIATPTAGLIVYDSTTNKLQCYNGTIWNDLF